MVQDGARWSKMVQYWVREGVGGLGEALMDPIHFFA